MSGFIEFGGNDGTPEPFSGGKNNRFKAKEGESYRVSFAWWPESDGSVDMDATKPRFVGAHRNYIQGAGYVLNKGAEYTKIAGDPPKMAIATIIVVWPTDAQGRTDKTRINAGDFLVQPWVFSESKYNALQPTHREFHLGNHDITITCADTQYQKLTFSPCKENLLRKLGESKKGKGKDVYDSIMSQVTTISAGIENEIARDLTLDQVREKLGQSGTAPSDFDFGGDDEVDDMIDDILDA